MKKTVIADGDAGPPPDGESWLDIEALAEIEITSDDPEHPIDAALEIKSTDNAWRAPNPGEQMIRVCFFQPQSIKRIRLVFEERTCARTQEVAIRWLPFGTAEEYREIVRQQYNFSPPATTQEIEDYQVDLEKLKILELIILPEIGGGEARASLKELRLA